MVDMGQYRKSIYLQLGLEPNCKDKCKQKRLVDKSSLESCCVVLLVVFIHGYIFKELHISAYRKGYCSGNIVCLIMMTPPEISVTARVARNIRSFHGILHICNKLIIND